MISMVPGIQAQVPHIEKTRKIQKNAEKWHTLLCMSFFFCNFAANLRHNGITVFRNPDGKEKDKQFF